MEEGNEYAFFMTQQTFSIWVMPQGKIAEELRLIIARLAKCYLGPVFPPHVTVLGRIPNVSEKDAIEKSGELAKKLRPYALTFDRLATDKEFYRCLYVRMKRTEHALMAFQAARMLFHFTDREEYVPHLSLFYGSVTEAEKDAAMRDVTLEMGASFAVDTLILVDTSGKPEAWKQIGEFGFG